MNTNAQDELDILFAQVANYFSLLSEPTRLKILHSLCDGEKNVTQIVESTGASQTNVSRHLNMMLREGALSRRKEGTTAFYSVTDQTVVELCRTVCTHVAARAHEQTPSNKAVRQFMNG